MIAERAKSSPSQTLFDRFCHEFVVLKQNSVEILSFSSLFRPFFVSATFVNKARICVDHSNNWKAKIKLKAKKIYVILRIARCFNLFGKKCYLSWRRISSLVPFRITINVILRPLQACTTINVVNRQVDFGSAVQNYIWLKNLVTKFVHLGTRQSVTSQKQCTQRSCTEQKPCTGQNLVTVWLSKKGM